MMRKKRSTSATSEDAGVTTSKTESKRKRSTGCNPKESVPETPNESVFCASLRAAGMSLGQGEEPNKITVDQIVFQSKIQKKLEKNPRYPEILQEFITGLESHIEDPELFKKCLLPSVSEAEEDSNVGTSVKESLLHMLLGIDILQTLIINLLFEKLPEFMIEGTPPENAQIPNLIIKQLKWLNRIVDSKDLTSKLMELVSVAPMAVQRDVIISLPEILEDSQHHDVARVLNSFLQEGSQLTLPILDAFSSLSLSPSLLTEVRGTLMTTFASVKLGDLPLMVKFILHSVTEADTYEVVCHLREKLELEQLVLPPVLQASQSGVKGRGAQLRSTVDSSQDIAGLVLDMIKTSMRFQKSICDAWLKAVEAVKEVQDHKVIDVLLLLILHSTNAFQSRRGAERVMKMKVKAGLIQEALIQKTLKNFTQIVHGYFSSIMALAQIFLHSSDLSLMPFGRCMYRHSFTAFDSICRQEVVNSLVTHTCSGEGTEVDMALELLRGLTEEQPAEISQYAVFIKGILDYVDNLKPQQIRRLYYILGRLAFWQLYRRSSFQDEMYILICKQLSSKVPKYKRMGVIGTVSMIGSIAGHRSKQTELMLKEPLPQEILKQVSDMMELVKSSSEHSPEFMALYYDELATLIQAGQLFPQLQKHIADGLHIEFQDDFVVDLEPEISGSFPLPAQYMYQVEEDANDQAIAINLLPLVAKDLQRQLHPLSPDTKRQISPLCLAPFFRLLSVCEALENNGDLEGIDALLSCAVILTDMEAVEKIESLSKTEKELLCSLLFHTINWFRELINAFCTQKQPELKMRVLRRLQNITYLQTLLEKALAATPGYVPPIASFDGRATEKIVRGSFAPVKRTKRDATGKKKKAPEKSSTQLDDSGEGDRSQQEQPEKKKEKEVRPSVDLAAYRTFFRELGLGVLQVLQSGTLSRSLMDSELHTNVREDVLLGPAELRFLLGDMLLKVKFSFPASAKKSPFRKGNTDADIGFSLLQQMSTDVVASCCVELLPALCSHLERVPTTLQNDNDSMVDAPATDAQECDLMASCCQLILQILNTTFSWIGFSQRAHQGLLEKALRVLAERFKDGDAELTLEELIKHSIEYLVKFRDWMRSLSSALCLSQLVATISEKGGNPAAYREQNASLAKHFLSREWVTANGEKERGSKFNEGLHSLLSIYLQNTGDVLTAIEEIAGEGIPELINAGKDESSPSWPTLSRKTFLVFYKVLMAELHKASKMIPASKSTDSPETQAEMLMTWNLAVRDFHILVNLVKVFDSRPVIGACLKYGRQFLDSFLKLGMPLLDCVFKKHKDDVLKLLKTFQLSTRQLHHMCAHSKIHQDVCLTNHVPALKKSLELFVYRVKATLTLHKCQEAFWIGNLKNRTLQGEVIPSQEPEEEEEDEEEEEEGDEEGEGEEGEEDDSGGEQEEEAEEVAVEEEEQPGPSRKLPAQVSRTGKSAAKKQKAQNDTDDTDDSDQDSDPKTSRWF